MLYLDGYIEYEILVDMLGLDLEIQRVDIDFVVRMNNEVKKTITAKCPKNKNICFKGDL